MGKRLQDAVRSSPGSLAWLDAADGRPIGVNPAQVVTVSAC